MPSHEVSTHLAAVLSSHAMHCFIRRIYGFEVVVVAGEGLILRGRSPTYYAKQMAQHAVMKTTALPILANEIQVAAAPAAGTLST